jgi:tripartite-type tricarboxylate transporter receptor subunit TctC
MCRSLVGSLRPALMLLWPKSRLQWRTPLRSIIRLAVSLVALVFAEAAFAQSYPDKPVRIVVGFAAGGPTDVVARIVADKLSATLGKQFYVVNQPGAGGNTATGMVASSPGDGYTLLVVSTGFVVNPSLFAKVPYDPVKDFAPVTMVAVSPNVITVHPSVPAKTIKELIDLIKANPRTASTFPPSSSPVPAPPCSRRSAATHRWHSPPSPRRRRRSRRACCAVWR